MEQQQNSSLNWQNLDRSPEINISNTGNDENNEIYKEITNLHEHHNPWLKTWCNLQDYDHGPYKWPNPQT